MNLNVKLIGVGNLVTNVIAHFSLQNCKNIVYKTIDSAIVIDTEFDNQLSSFLKTGTGILILVFNGENPKEFKTLTHITQLAQKQQILTLILGVIPNSLDSLNYTTFLDQFHVLSSLVDSCLVIDSNRLVDINTSMSKENLKLKLEELIVKHIKGIYQLSHFPDNSYFKSSLKDLRTLFEQSNYAVYTEGSGKGENRAYVAFQRAIKNLSVSPQSIIQANRVLVTISTGNKELTIDEIAQINDRIYDLIDEPNIIMGIKEDEQLKDKLSVQIIFAGIDWIGEVLG